MQIFFVTQYACATLHMYMLKAPDTHARFISHTHANTSVFLSHVRVRPPGGPLGAVSQIWPKTGTDDWQQPTDGGGGRTHMKYRWRRVDVAVVIHDFMRLWIADVGIITLPARPSKLRSHYVCGPHSHSERGVHTCAMCAGRMNHNKIMIRRGVCRAAQFVVCIVYPRVSLIIARVLYLWRLCLL